MTPIETEQTEIDLHLRLPQGLVDGIAKKHGVDPLDVDETVQALVHEKMYDIMITAYQTLKTMRDAVPGCYHFCRCSFVDRAAAAEDTE